LVYDSWHRVAVASYLRRKGTPALRDVLAAHDGLGLRQTDEAHVWSLTYEHRPDKKATVAYAPCLQSDDMGTLKVAARMLGIVALPGYVGRKEVESGLLVRVLPQWHAGIATLSILMPSRRGLLPSVRAFIDFLSTYVPPAVT